MRAQTLSTLVALASGIQAVVATKGWSAATSFNCPANTDNSNSCTDQQKSSGWDWSDLTPGNSVPSSYDSCSFSKGWGCASSFHGNGKRDLTRRDFQSKCITNTAHKDKNSCPSWSAPQSGSGGGSMSITELQISVQFNCDLELWFGMEDGSNCVQKQSCSTEGTLVKNSQCGGAKNVTIVYPSSVPGKDTCSIGVHSVGYDCSTASSTHSVTYHPTSTVHSYHHTSAASTTLVTTTPSTTAVASSASSSASSVVVSSTPSSAVVSSTPSSAVVSSTPSSAVVSSTPSSAVVSSTPSASVPVVSSLSSSIPSIISTTHGSNLSTTAVISVSSSQGVSSSASSVGSSTVVVSSPAVTTGPAESTNVVSTSVFSSEIITTEVVVTTVTTCPVTSTVVSAGSTTVITSIGVSTVVITSTTEVCPVCEASSTAAVSSTVAVSSPAQSSPAQSSAVVSTLVTVPSGTVGNGVTTTVTSVTTETATCPDILPSCLNTWMFQTGCGDNTASDCYCSQSTFISNVYSCLSAHGASSQEIYDAQQYLQGICGSYIPSNPAVVTCASTFTDVVTQTVQQTVPVTALSYATTIVQPVTVTAGASQGQTVAGSSTTIVISTIITVPQVQFATITETGAGSSPTGVAALVPVAPGGAAAVTTPASGGSGSGVGFNSTKTTASLTVAATTGLSTFTGAASKSNIGSSFAGLVAAALVAAVL